jgi:ATP-dependent Lon protease
MPSDPLNEKLNGTFAGRAVRKDLVHRLKKGTNIPTFVLEFLLAKYCASDDAEEIEQGLKAVNERLQGNYVRPNESNLAQSMVEQKGQHRFIDKVHVTYKEREKRHWAEMENFGSKRIAISERHYKENPRLLEGGLWCEVSVAHHGVEEDDYAFIIEDLRPIQISRFSFDAFAEGRAEFTRDEWLSVLLRSIGIETDGMDRRLQFHFLARLFPLVEQNYNFLELGPRGTGKSYAYSEFSPYSTLMSGGQTSTATLFYNKVKGAVGIIGYWDVIAFDEVAGVRIKDPGTVQILKDYMANGHFNLGTEVIAQASLAFVGNIDDSIEQIVRSEKFDLCKPLPKEFDLAVIHRFHTYVPGWEIPPMSSSLLTQEYGLISDYLAEAFHYLARKQNLYSDVKKRARLGKTVEGRDETAIIKTVAAMQKLLHPGAEPSDEEFEEYLAYATEGRRRVKEQLNKRKNDDEFAQIDLSFTNSKGETVVITCPESKGIEATINPRRGRLEEPGREAKESRVKPESTTPESLPAKEAPKPEKTPSDETSTPEVPTPPELKEQHIDIHYNDRGFSYRTLFGDYLRGAKTVTIEDPYIRTHHQIVNFLRFCEACVEGGTVQKIHLITGIESEYHKEEQLQKLGIIEESLSQHGVELTIKIDDKIHDREVRLDNGWAFRLGRGLDYFQRPDDWLELGANDLDLRPCQETKISIIRKET